MAVDVEIKASGVQASAALISRAGRKSQDQSSSLRAAGESARAQPGGWVSRTGALSASVRDPRSDASADRLRLYSAVPYGRFVFWGTQRQAPRPPQVNAQAIASDASRRIASDLVRP